MPWTRSLVWTLLFKHSDEYLTASWLKRDCPGSVNRALVSASEPSILLWSCLNSLIQQKQGVDERLRRAWNKSLPPSPHGFDLCGESTRPSAGSRFIHFPRRRQIGRTWQLGPSESEAPSLGFGVSIGCSINMFLNVILVSLLGISSLNISSLWDPEEERLDRSGYCSRKVVDLYSGDTSFEFWLGHRPTCLRISSVPPDKFRDSVSIKARSLSSKLSDSSFMNHRIIWGCSVRAPDSAIKWTTRKKIKRLEGTENITLLAWLLACL